MGWVRQKGDDWLVFDDADVSECKTEDILKLSGGGDWHMAYLCFYRCTHTHGLTEISSFLAVERHVLSRCRMAPA
jgi:hypothetical protein